MLQHVDISDNSQRHERRQPALLLLLLSASVLLAFHPGMRLLLFDPSVTRYVCCHVLRGYGTVQRWWGGGNNGRDGNVGRRENCERLRPADETHLRFIAGAISR